jgi:SMC interacting uncharacterized protein involved in chromosome segregation
MMKKSKLTLSIKEEIIGILAEATPEDIENQKELNRELEKTADLVKDSGLVEEFDTDEEPTAKQLKGDSISILATKLQQTTKELKSTVNKWKTAEGDEKSKLRDKLLKLTKIKKEIEAAL